MHGFATNLTLPSPGLVIQLIGHWFAKSLGPHSFALNQAAASS
jgi:hypothetical protein